MRDEVCEISRGMVSKWTWPKTCFQSTCTLNEALTRVELLFYFSAIQHGKGIILLWFLEKVTSKENHEIRKKERLTRITRGPG